MATQEQVADHIDLSSRQVRTLVKQGVLPSGSGAGGLSVDDCRQAYIRYLRGKATGKVSVSTATLDAQEERARLTHHQANIAALEEKEKLGELVRRDEVIAEVSEAIANCRARLLTIPTKLSTVVIGLDDVQAVRGALQAGVHEALDELYSQYATDEQSGEDVEESTNPDGERVG